MRQKMLCRSKQIGTKPPALLLGPGNGSARQQMGEEIMRQFARGFRIPQIAAEEGGHRLVIGVA
jgi:hypothetical protein